MKTYILILLSVILSSSLIAQPNPMEIKDISIAKEKVRISFYEHADEPLGEEYKTYNVFVETPSDWNDEMHKAALKSCFIEGFEEVGGEADLSIILQVAGFTLGKDTVFTSRVKDKNGNISQYESIIEVPYKLKYTTKLINNHTGQPLYNHTQNDNGKWRSKTIKDTPLTNFSELSRVQRSLPQQMKEFTLEKAESLALGSRWSAQYGSRYVMSDTEYARIKESKHYETYYFLAELQKFDTRRSDKKDFIDYNLNLVDKYKNALPKVQTKIKAIAYYNLANVYYWDDEFATAREYIAKGLETGELKSEFNRISKDCDKYEKKLRMNNKASRKER